MNNCEGWRKNHAERYHFIGCHDYVQEMTKKGLKMFLFVCNILTYVIGTFAALQEVFTMPHEGLCTLYLNIILREIFMLGLRDY